MASTHDLASVPTDVISRYSVTGESASGASSGSSSCPFTDQISHFEDPVLEAIKAACSLACPVHLEAILFETLMQEVSVTSQDYWPYSTLCSSCSCGSSCHRIQECHIPWFMGLCSSSHVP